MSNNLMIVYDADKAGLKATLRAWTAALSLGMDVKIAALPAGEDPASILLSNKEKFKEALKHSKHIIDYYLDILLGEKTKEKFSERKLWKAIEIEVVPYIAAVESAIDRAHFITTTSIRTGIPEDALGEQVQKQQVQQRSNGPSTPSTPTSSVDDVTETDQSKELPSDAGEYTLKDKVLERLIGYILLERSKKTDEAKLQVLLDRVKAIVGEEEYKTIDMVLQQNSQALIFEAEMMFEGNNTTEKDIEELFFSIEEKIIKQTFEQSMRELQQAERSGDKERAMMLLTKCQGISLQLSTLNHKRKLSTIESTKK